MRNFNIAVSETGDFLSADADGIVVGSFSGNTSETGIRTNKDLDDNSIDGDVYPGFNNQSTVKLFSHIRIFAHQFNNSDRTQINQIRLFTVDTNTTTELQEQGTNCTIDIDDYILDETQEAAQAPIKPYTSTKPVGYVARKLSTL